MLSPYTCASRHSCMGGVGVIPACRFQDLIIAMVRCTVVLVGVIGPFLALAAALQFKQSVTRANPSTGSAFIDQETANAIALLRPASIDDHITNLTANKPVQVICSASQCGRDLNPHSCLDAWSRLPAVDRELSFGWRRNRPTDLTWDVYLPKRYSSCAQIPQLGISIR